jgi:DNA-binding NarL/FixJ family response regulator
MDVQGALTQLTPREQAICAALARGETCSGIAKELAISRSSLNGMIRHIRGQYRTVGL